MSDEAADRDSSTEPSVTEESTRPYLLLLRGGVGALVGAVVTLRNHEEQVLVVYGAMVVGAALALFFLPRLERAAQATGQRGRFGLNSMLLSTLRALVGAVAGWVTFHVAVADTFQNQPETAAILLQTSIAMGALLAMLLGTGVAALLGATVAIGPAWLVIGILFLPTAILSLVLLRRSLARAVEGDWSTFFTTDLLRTTLVAGLSCGLAIPFGFAGLLPYLALLLLAGGLYVFDPPDGAALASYLHGVEVPWGERRAVEP